MEGGISRLDSYEDMFKEITKKLYGEELQHTTSSVQNEFETSVSYRNDEDTGNGTDGSDDGNWTCEEEPLKGTDGSRIAAYHPSKGTWRCYECGDVMGGGPREAAEHFMELHSSRILADESRHRHHSPRKDYLQADLKVDDIVTYLERLRERAERTAPPSRRTQETQTLPATLLSMTPSFLLQELPSTPQPQHLYQTTSPPSTSAPATSAAVKRYNCHFCSYGTDRRDLYSRHENIHKEEKPFQCPACHKPFNRADHVKKHFGRMHREDKYDVAKIRRPPETRSIAQDSIEAMGSNNILNGPQQATTFQYTNNRGYQPQAIPGTSNNVTIYQTPTVSNTVVSGMSQTEATTSRRGQSGSQSNSKTKNGSKNASDRRFPCPQCPWTGTDNWCLKRHLNTHIKPFLCTMCDYKAARSERLATHMGKVHGKKQCTKCGLLCENEEELEMHQSQTHRMGNASSSRSAQSASRVMMQQPLLPSGGGRPPPGPPVFPAPAQPIPQITTSVMPPANTTLGPLARLFGVTSMEKPIVIKLNIHQVSGSPAETKHPSRQNEEPEVPSTSSTSTAGGRKRPRKQPYPQKYTEVVDDSDMYDDGIQPSAVKRHRRNEGQVNIQTEQSVKASPRLFRCILCPRHTAARGILSEGHRPYHSRASLALHKLWRHRRRTKPLQSPIVSTINPSSLVSSITLKAIFVARPNYNYYR